MLRGLIVLLLVLCVAFLSLPFVMTSRALDEHGITLPGSVYYKGESVRVSDSGWDVARDVTIQYSVPETRSTGFFAVHPDVQRYDSLHIRQAVAVRYLRREDLPKVPGAESLAQMHLLPTAKLADDTGVSRLIGFRKPGIILGGEMLGGILAALILWRITKVGAFAWGAGIGVAVFFGFFLVQGFPKRMPAPVREVRHAAGRVKSVGRIDRLFTGSRTRGLDASQPVDVVGLEFVPEGRAEAVVAVDAIDSGSVAGLKETDSVTVDYEADSPRTAYIQGATRRFPERNFSGAMVAGVVYLAVVGGLLWLAHRVGQGYRRLVRR